MKKVSVCLWTCLVLMFLVSIFPALAAEETFPTRPITLINSLPAGGGTDLAIRLLAEKAGKILGQSVIVTNITGGMFMSGVVDLQQAKPNGYTIGFLAPSAMFIIPHTEKTPYDPLKDFKPIIQFGAMNWGVIVKADAPYKTWRELMEAGKTTKLRFGTAGPKSFGAVLVSLMAKKDGVSFIQIPYKGTSESETSLIGGHVDLAAGDFSYSLVEAGKTRPILMLADKQSPMYPQIQCIKDVGFGYPVPASFLLGAPKDTPDPIMKKLEEDFTKATKDSDYIKGIANLRYLTTYRSSIETARYMRDTFEGIGDMLKEAGLKN